MSLSDLFSGKVWLGFSKDEAVGTGTYRFTLAKNSLVGIASNFLSVGKVYSFSGYTFAVANIENTDDGKVIVTADMMNAPATGQANALTWGLILGGLGAVLLLNSIEKIEKLVDTTTTRTIQLVLAAAVLLIVWKIAKR